MEPFLGEIRAFPFNFAPRGWALCQGQTLAISQNPALFALLGTTYGGNGQTTFALPNLQGRAATNMGQGPGLTSYQQGTIVGTESVTLTTTQMPAHTHGSGTASSSLPVSRTGATTTDPSGAYFAVGPAEEYGATANHGATAATPSGSSGVAGGSQPHENRQPLLVLNYCIALQGDFPIRP